MLNLYSEYLPWLRKGEELGWVLQRVWNDSEIDWDRVDRRKMEGFWTPNDVDEKLVKILCVGDSMFKW